MIEYQLFAQKQKPDRFVVVAAYGDLATGYICTEQAFFQGGYEPGASHVAPKSEGILKEAICKLLELNCADLPGSTSNPRVPLPGRRPLPSPRGVRCHVVRSAAPQRDEIANMISCRLSKKQCTSLLHAGGSR
jgi:hypothetical protein